MKKVRKIAAVLLCAAFVTASANALTVSAAGTVYAKTTADLNVRKGAGTNYSKITVLDENTKVTVIDRSNPDWLKVKLTDGTTGYCYADYLDITTDGYTTDYVNVRYGPSTGYGVIKTVPMNTKVDIIRFSGVSWAYVKLSDGTKGYMCTDYVTYASPSSTKTSGTTVSTDIKLSDNSKRIAVGTSYTLKASNNLGTVNWTTSDPKIAKVDKGGKVTAVSAGSAIITAKDANTKKSVKCTISAVKTDFTKITLSDTSKNLSVGESFTLKVKTDTNSKNVKFKSSDKTVASVDQNGRITAVSSGSANVKAYDSTGAVTAVCKITVKGKDSISLSSSNITVDAGSSKLLTVKTSNSSMKVKWTSSNEKVASVYSGTVSGLSAGTAVITASDSTGKICAKCNVIVTGVSRGDLSVSHTLIDLPLGQSILISGNKKTKLTWKTSNQTVADVSDGLIEAKNIGKAAVSYCDNSGHKAICVVNVVEAEPVIAVFSSPNLAKVGENVTLTAITDTKVTDLYFKVDIGGNITTVRQSGKRTEEKTYVWTAVFKPASEGNFTITAYAFKNGTWSTCKNGKSDIYVSNKNRSSSYLEDHRTSKEAIDFIRDKEGFTKNAIYDPIVPSHLTIGHGCTLWTGDNFYNSMTPSEAYALLVQTVNNKIAPAVNKFLRENRIKSNQQQFDSLTSFTFNMGIYWFGGDYDFVDDLKRASGKSLSNINDNIITDNMTQFTLSGGYHWKGLLYRRIDEAEMFVYGDYKCDGEDKQYKFSYPSYYYR